LNKAAVAAVAAVALAAFMLLQDLVSGPSLSLLALNSTILSVLMVVLVSLLAAALTVRDARTNAEHFRWVRRTPVGEMAETLKGANDGFTSNRREVARTLRWAVGAKFGNETGTRSQEAVDTYLKSILSPRSFEEFFSESDWRASKVEASRGYLVRLKEVVTSVGQSLEF
jgi:hypothetical protein